MNSEASAMADPVLPDIRKFSIMGVRCDALTLSDLTRAVEQAIARKRERCVVAHHNLHSLYLYHNDSRMRDFYTHAEYVHADGMSVILFARLLGLAMHRSHRVTYVDWIGPLMKTAAEQGWRIFYLGSKPGVGEKGSSILRARFPSLCLDTAHGYFDARPTSTENRAIVKRIRLFGPHVLMVGMGMPRQEHWLLDNLEDLSANAILLSGAAMDYVAGTIPTPPRWSGRIGIEWLFRLASEPGRLWKRYLLEPWFLLKLLATQRRGVRPSAMSDSNSATFLNRSGPEVVLANPDASALSEASQWASERVSSAEREQGGEARLD